MQNPEEGPQPWQYVPANLEDFTAATTEPPGILLPDFWTTARADEAAEASLNTLPKRTEAEVRIGSMPYGQFYTHNKQWNLRCWSLCFVLSRLFNNYFCIKAPLSQSSGSSLLKHMPWELLFALLAYLHGPPVAAPLTRHVTTLVSTMALASHLDHHWGKASGSFWNPRDILHSMGEHAAALQAYSSSLQGRSEPPLPTLQAAFFPFFHCTLGPVAL